MKTALRIGTRGSMLALYQANLVSRLLKEKFPYIDPILVKIQTAADKDQVSKIQSLMPAGSESPFATKRVFTKEIEQALLAKEIDLAVHSAKDVAVDLPPGLICGAVPDRDDSRDCFVSRTGIFLKDMPAGSKIGTSSLRRKKQLLRHRPDLVVEEIRGNVETRVRKCKAGDYDGVILAYAGLKRINLTQHVAEIFEHDFFYPAPGQGCLLVEVREDDAAVRDLAAAINRPESAAQLECERAFLKHLEGGCQLPCGISVRLKERRFNMKGILFDIEGPGHIEQKCEFPAGKPSEAGIHLAEMILEAGGRKIIDKIRSAGDQSDAGA